MKEQNGGQGMIISLIWFVIIPLFITVSVDVLLRFFDQKPSWLWQILILCLSQMLSTLALFLIVSRKESLKNW